MKRTKVKGDMHYCPRCGASAEKALEIVTVDVKKQQIGNRYNVPYYAHVLRCKKCGWSGGWSIPKDKLKKCERDYQKYLNSSKSHIKKTKFR